MKFDIVGGKVRRLDARILSRLCGKIAHAKIKKEDNRSKLPAQSMTKLEACRGIG